MYAVVQRSRLDLRKNFFQSPSSRNLEQFATKCCQLHICHDVEEKTEQALYAIDMSVKGVAHQAHYHQSPSQIIAMSFYVPFCLRTAFVRLLTYLPNLDFYWG